jgi:glyoxylase-like metal-dependent hydrolase (beta-lactamase superfamily II)
VEKWIATLDAAKALGAKVICPGHGPRGLQVVLDDQQAFFQQLRERTGALVQAKKSAKEIQASVPQMTADLKSHGQIRRYVGDGLTAQVEKVYNEMTGDKFPDNSSIAQAARHKHRNAHALQIA